MGKADENGLLNFIHICTLDYPERTAYLCICKFLTKVEVAKVKNTN